MKETLPISVFTDGSSRGNPGPGGYGVVLQSGTHYKELSQGYRCTTNNRMELMAVIVALEALKKPGSAVVVYSDSSYVVKAVEQGWLPKWVATDFKKKKNEDLWRRYLCVAAKHQVRFVWIKGHAGHPQNERCDQLAVMASQQEPLQEDSGYLNDV